MYREKCSDACKQLFLTGQEEYMKRKSEEDCLRSCIEDAKQDSKRRALESTEQYKETKKAIKKKLDGLYQDSFPEVAEALLSDLRQAIYELWNDLMGNEVSLVDQLEEIITDFGRNMSEMVSGFTESVQVCFSKIRESAASFNERLAEMTLTYAERLAKTEQQQQKSDHDSSIYLDRDNLVNALNNSKEVHVAVIDKCEENVNKNLKQWLENLIEDLHQKEEYERHTNRVIEINMFIDDQRVDLETSELPQI
ncbi:Dynein regulatory complex subunit 3 [Sparganum proliferum]